jgi:hypothetical protein
MCEAFSVSGNAFEAWNPNYVAYLAHSARRMYIYCVRQISYPAPKKQHSRRVRGGAKHTRGFCVERAPLAHNLVISLRQENLSE